MNYKEIHIGNLIHKRAAECNIDISRICNFMKCTETEVQEMYALPGISTENLLKWSKLLKYDFFRIFTQHLILYAPPGEDMEDGKNTTLPQFRKNVYTKEVIDFILEMLESGEMTKREVMEKYRIPKTTLYKWAKKYKK